MTFSRQSFWAMRFEYLCVLVTCVALGFMHIGEINWIRYVLLFACIDLVGYLPGAIAHRRGNGAPLEPAYYVLYNVTHSFVFAGVLAALWCLTLGPEWALLALPVHLCGDRALFGNIFKSRSEPFEPEVINV